MRGSVGPGGGLVGPAISGSVTGLPVSASAFGFSTAGIGTVVPLRLFPSRYAGNPIIPVQPPGEPSEQYAGAFVQLTNGDIWGYIKGTLGTYAYLSTNDGTVFVGQNGGGYVIAPGSSGQWNDVYSIEPTAVFDSANTLIHLWFKGGGGGAPGWGHATAPEADPTDVTLDVANPILTSAAIAAQMGGGVVGDTNIFDVVPFGGAYHFFAYVQYNGRYQIVHLTGTTWNDPDVSTLTVLLVPPSDAIIAATGSVFRLRPGVDLFGMLYTWGPTPGRTIRMGVSTDLVTWGFADTTDILSPVPSTWESYHVYVPRILKDDITLDPIEDVQGRLKVYYSGADVGWAHSQEGLFYHVVTITGVAATSFGWFTEAFGSGPAAGVADSAFGFSTAATGLVAQPVQNVTVADSAFGFSTAGTGLAATSPVLGVADSAFGWRSDSAGVVGSVSVTGTGASEFGWSTTADGTNVAPPSTGLPRDQRIWRMFYQRVGAWYMLRKS